MTSPTLPKRKAIISASKRFNGRKSNWLKVAHVVSGRPRV
jgi:hypothetical protein